MKLRPNKAHHLEVMTKQHHINVFYNVFINDKEREFIASYLKEDKDETPLPKIKDEFIRQENEMDEAFKGFSKEEKINYATKLAKTGNATAISFLGACYYNGYLVSKDVKKGLELFVEAAILGYPYAMRELWQVHYDGLFNEDAKVFDHSISDRSLCYFWEFLAAINGEAYSQYSFADHLMSGKYDFYGFDKDAFHLLELATNQDVRSARYLLVSVLLSKNDEFYDRERAISIAKYYAKRGEYNTFAEILGQYDEDYHILDD